MIHRGRRENRRFLDQEDYPLGSWHNNLRSTNLQPIPFLRLYAETRAFGRGRPVSARLAPDGQAALFLRAPPRGQAQALLETDLSTGATRVLLGPAGEPGRELSAEERGRLERQHVTARRVTAFHLSRDGRTVLAEAGGQVVLLDRASGRSRRIPVADGAATPRLSPDGKKLAFVRAGELYVLDLASGRARQVTGGAEAWLTHGLAEFVAQEEMSRFEGFWWPPDSRHLAFQETDDDSSSTHVSGSRPARSRSRSVSSAVRDMLPATATLRPVLSIS